MSSLRTCIGGAKGGGGEGEGEEQRGGEGAEEARKLRVGFGFDLDDGAIRVCDFTRNLFVCMYHREEGFVLVDRIFQQRVNVRDRVRVG